ncbi:hypothetical protein [uncultured Brachyspira sp.]|uniref:hypothetical protein n=1 Tax=uncultured Brachyspira sp. TaxID=221953 RepID=UPI0025E7B5CC|nr:hypothetical protein [uncultured Brachyspira sp.]
MAKISEAAKAECNRMQNKYKNFLAGVESKLTQAEKELLALEDDFQKANKKVELAVLYVQASSFVATICYIAIEHIDVRSDNQLNDGRRYINKAIMLLEEVFGNYTDDSLSMNEEMHEYFKDKLSDEWRYKFICSFGYIIDYLKYCYGENSKWLQNFIEIEARFAVIAKNIIDFKSYIKELSPEVAGYKFRVKLMELVKKLLEESAEEYRTKYELQDKRIDDMKMALNIVACLRRIHIYLNEVEESEEKKKMYDLWKKKLDADIKKMK